jgi:hypothetical protein
MDAEEKAVYVAADKLTCKNVEKETNCKYKMKIIIYILTVMLLASCATPNTVQRESDYEICRLSILRPPLQSFQAINEADRQIRTRGVNCSAYAGNIMHQQQIGLQQMQQGLQMMQQGSTVQQQQPPKNQIKSNQPTVQCTRMGDWNRAVITFNGIACPIGYAPF